MSVSDVEPVVISAYWASNVALLLCDHVTRGVCWSLVRGRVCVSDLIDPLPAGSDQQYVARNFRLGAVAQGGGRGSSLQTLSIHIFTVETIKN